MSRLLTAVETSACVALALINCAMLAAEPVRTRTVVVAMIAMIDAFNRLWATGIQLTARCAGELAIGADVSGAVSTWLRLEV